jgi:hypothetical protein
MAGAPLAPAPGLPLAAVVDCLPGAPPHPVTALAASAARTLTATARE